MGLGGRGDRVRGAGPDATVRAMSRSRGHPEELRSISRGEVELKKNPLTLRTCSACIIVAVLATSCTRDVDCGPQAVYNSTVRSCIGYCGSSDSSATCLERDGAVREGGVDDVMISDAPDSAEVACSAEEVRCGAVCAVLATSPEHCGACGRACPSPANGTSTCAQGRCAVRCGAGFELVAERCEVPVSRLVAPLSASYVSTTRPILRWQLPAGATGARIELCTSRPCGPSEVVASAIVTGSSAPAPLPMSATPTQYFWQVRAIVGDVTASRPSALWSFIPRSRGTGSTAVLGSSFDMDGDGRGDIAISAPQAEWMGNRAAGVVVVELSDAASMSTPLRFGGQAVDEQLGLNVLNAGDVNGDGYSDLMVSVLRAGSQVQIYLGGPRSSLRIDAPSQVLEAPIPNKLFGHALAALGDVDFDGYGDVLIGAPLEDEAGVQRTGAVYLYRGSATGLREPQRVAGSRASGYFGASVAAAGDFDGDGYADALVGEPNQILNPSLGPGEGAALVLLGSSVGLDRVGVRWTGPGAGSLFGKRVQLLGDVNGDGRPDVAVAAPGDGRMGYLSGGSVSVFAATGATLPRAPLVELWGDNDRQQLGAALAAGDLNGDGFDDVVASASDLQSTTTGEVWVYAGSAMGPRVRSDRLRATAMGTGFGAAIAVGGPRLPGDPDSLFVAQPYVLGGSVERFDARAFPLTLSAHLGSVSGQYGSSITASR